MGREGKDIVMGRCGLRVGHDGEDDGWWKDR